MSASIELQRGAQLSECTPKKPGGMLRVLNKACLSYKSGKSGDKMGEDSVQDLFAKLEVCVIRCQSENLRREMLV